METEVGVEIGDVAVGVWVREAMADAHHCASKASTVAPIVAPQAPREQSCIPFWKLTFWHKQAGSAPGHPSADAWPIMLLKQV
jgi:hypothetical protein